MWDLRKQIVETAHGLGIVVSDVSQATGERIFSNVVSRFARGSTMWPLWEHLERPVIACDATAWKWIENYIGDREGILFFDPHDEPRMYSIGSGRSVVAVLSEMFNTDFYITDRGTSYLLAFNDHDQLFATGEARGWLLEHRPRDK